MDEAEPKVTRVYQNHHLDSTRWEVYSPRDGDLIVTTAYKAGTTWTQQILQSLLHDDANDTALFDVSPWIDARFQGSTKDQLREKLEALPDRRFVKSHLPLDGLPYYRQVRYLVVARDPRDVFMSLYNHFQNYTDVAYAMVNTPDAVGDPLPRCPDDPRALYRQWITRGWFPWESEGWPFWSNLHHTQSYWDYRALPNLLLLHYNDMLADLEGAVRRIARFADIDADDARIARTVEHTTFANVKQRADDQSAREGGKTGFFRGGASAFFFKGQNGRWRDVLTDDDLALYEEAKQRVLSPDCARWLEQGGAVACAGDGRSEQG